MKKTKQLPLLQNVPLIDTAHDGLCIGRIDDLVVLVKGGVPGDVVDVQLTRKKKKIAEGFITDIKSKSEYRIDSFCSHFGVCGGCKWQNMSYKAQLIYKQKQVKDSLERIAHITSPKINSILASSFETDYRNKLEFTFSDKRWLHKSDFDLAKEQILPGLGFHFPGLFDKVVDIHKCWLMPGKPDELRELIRNFASDNKLSFFNLRAQTGDLRNLVVRKSNTGQWMVIVIFYTDELLVIEKLMNHIKQNCNWISSLYYIVNRKKNDSYSDQNPVLFDGIPEIVEDMDGLKFGIGPLSFFQTNSTQALNLYKLVKEQTASDTSKVIYDLYTGTGTIANFVAAQAKKVIGIEYVDAAVEDAKKNALRNHINNALFFAGDMKNVLNTDFIERHGKPDIIITDPPRAGMHEDVVKKILEVQPEKIIYVSCNPSTQARDLLLLKEHYQLTYVQPVDMFPHTQHVENIVTLNRIKE